MIAKRFIAGMAVTLVSSTGLLWAQNPAASASTLEEGRKVYAERCVGCHGADARGTDQAPGLAGNSRLRNQSVRKLSDLIHNGIPGTAMPAFALPPRELDALANFVHSLNGEAAASDVPGNQAAGEQFFFGKGQCASCHMVFGRGAPIGPDLSNLGHSMTVNQIRSALIQPDTHITPGYEQATVQLRDGKPCAVSYAAAAILISGCRISKGTSTSCRKARLPRSGTKRDRRCLPSRPALKNCRT